MLVLAVGWYWFMHCALLRRYITQASFSEVSTARIICIERDTWSLKVKVFRNRQSSYHHFQNIFAYFVWLLSHCMRVNAHLKAATHTHARTHISFGSKRSHCFCRCRRQRCRRFCLPQEKNYVCLFCSIVQYICILDFFGYDWCLQHQTSPPPPPPPPEPLTINSIATVI